MGPALPDRTMPSTRNPQLPYPLPRVPPVMSPVEPPQLEEPAIKKKRKRADARQLEVLNSVYGRTAFPSTEERLKLANDLDMPPRSVQIWLAHPSPVPHL
jgi:homeobox protein YOX1/YHP1